MSQLPSSTLLLHNVAVEIRQVARIWRIEKAECGIQFRAEIGKTQFRIFVPRFDKTDSVQAPIERTPCHTAHDLLSLRNWLAELPIHANLATKNR